METTIDFLERLKAKYGGITDYRAHQVLGIPKSTVSAWRTGRTTMSDETALLFAKELDIHPAYVIACAHAERCKNPETVKIWEQIRNQFAASVIFAIPLMLLAFKAPVVGV